MQQPEFHSNTNESSPVGTHENKLLTQDNEKLLALTKEEKEAFDELIALIDRGLDAVHKKRNSGI